MKETILFIQLLVLSGSPGLLAQAPWQQHGKLEVSQNGHIIQHSDGTPFLWIGDTGWGMIQQLIGLIRVQDRRSLQAVLNKRRLGI